jgi:ubiquinol-cytochrome c reductase iron-sulfur subunit
MGLWPVLPRRRTRRLGQVPHAARTFRRRAPHAREISEADRDAFAAAIVERGGGVVKRRKVLGGLLGGGLGIFGIVALFPLVRSLGPLPKGTLFHTDWRKGTYAVDSTGRRVSVGDLAIGSIVTVYPEGTENTDRGQAVDQTVLIRISNENFVTKRVARPGGRTATSPTPRSARTSVVRSDSTSKSCNSLSARATSRCSTSPTAPSRSSVRLRDRCRSCRSTSTPRGTCAQDDYDQPVGPGFWERTTT